MARKRRELIPTTDKAEVGMVIMSHEIGQTVYTKTIGDDLDPSRGKAHWLVIRAEMQGGQSGGGMTGHDSYPPGLNITVKRLTSDKSGKLPVPCWYDSEGEEVSFYMSGSFCNMIHEVQVIGHMKPTWYWG